MGKSVHNDKVRIIATTILSVLLFIVIRHANASHQEFELFDQGYEYYLSYQPGKAIETFNAFLKEFPDSSAKDAAMFWLGKSLMQLKSFEDAEKIFSEMKQKFPGSPFISYVNGELENINKGRFKVSGTEPGINDEVKAKNNLEIKLAEVEKKAQLTGEDLQRALEERDRLKLLLEDEKEKTEGMRSQIARLTQQLELQVQKLNVDKALEENKRKELEDKVKKYEATAIKIKDKRYTAPQVFEYMITSSLVLTKLGIKEVLWRTGNFYEDFVDEHILFDEAKRLNIVEDMEKYKNLIEKYNFRKEDADYLFRYLTIGDLIDRKVKDMPGEKVVESLLIVYTKSDEFEKAILATELQKDAKSGRSFEDIYKSYPDVVRLRLIRFQELQGWIKDRIQLLQDGEISDVVWTEDRYIILRPFVKKLSYEPFEDIQPEIRDQMRTFVKRWIDGLRRGVKEIGIEGAE